MNKYAPSDFNIKQFLPHIKDKLLQKIFKWYYIQEKTIPQITKTLKYKNERATRWQISKINEILANIYVKEYPFLSEYRRHKKHDNKKGK